MVFLNSPSDADSVEVTDIFSGCVPGPEGCLVKLSDAIKKPWPEIPTMPSGAQAAVEPLRATT